ncbi:MAG: asparaginase [Pseudomonadota bacterium]
MANPVIAQVTRGTRVESIHRGAFAVVDGDGKIVVSRGDVEAFAFPRSSLKLMQALPLVESGAADAYGFGNRDLAMACASHSSSLIHVETASNMLKAANLSESDLQCGAHWPVFSVDEAVGMAQRGETPTRLHNNCSGKHSGFLCTCAHMGVSTHDYIDPDNELQRGLRAIVADLCGSAIADSECGLDGCSAPTFAVPIQSMAHAHARLVTGRALGAGRAKAAQRLMHACMAEPQMIADHGRYCTRLMLAAPGRVFAKTGAEGFYIAALPTHGWGVALKCDDGATRGAEVAIASILAGLLGEADPAHPALNAMARQTVRDWNGNDVGEVRAVSG